MPSKSESTHMPLPYSSRTADKFVLRLPDGMRQRISKMAANNQRSMNGEIIARIDGSLELEQKYEDMRQLNRFLNQKIAILEAAAQPLDEEMMQRCLTGSPKKFRGDVMTDGDLSDQD